MDLHFGNLIHAEDAEAAEQPPKNAVMAGLVPAIHGNGFRLRMHEPWMAA
jgi:hypothetical protein